VPFTALSRLGLFGSSLLKIKNWVFFGVLYLRVMMPFFPCPFGAFNKIIGAFLVLFRVRFRLPDASIGLKWGFSLCSFFVRFALPGALQYSFKAP